MRRCVAGRGKGLSVSRFWHTPLQHRRHHEPQLRTQVTARRVVSSGVSATLNVADQRQKDSERGYDTPMRTAIVATCCMLSCAAASAQDNFDSSLRIRPEAIRAHVRFLADDLLYYRSREIPRSMFEPRVAAIRSRQRVKGRNTGAVVGPGQ